MAKPGELPPLPHLDRETFLLCRKCQALIQPHEANSLGALARSNERRSELE